MFLTRLDGSFGVEDDVLVGDTGEDLEVILAESEEVVGTDGAGEQEVAPGAVGEGGERRGLDLIGGAQADGEDAFVDERGDVGDVLGGGLEAVR